MSNVQSFFQTAKTALCTLVLTFFLFGLQTLNAQINLTVCPSDIPSDGGTITYSVIATGTSAADQWESILIDVQFDETRLVNGLATLNANLDFEAVNSFSTGLYQFEGGSLTNGSFVGTTPVTVVDLTFDVIGDGPIDVSIDPSTITVLDGGDDGAFGSILSDLTLATINNQSVEEGQTLSLDFTQSVTDNCNSTSLTYDLTILNSSNAPVPSGDYDLTNGVFTWTPVVGAANTYSATLIVSNGSTEVTESFDITVTPAPNNDTQPVITLQGTALVNEDGTLDVPLSISDADGDNLTVSISSASNEPTILESTNSGKQRDPWPNNADAFLTETGITTAAGSYSSTLAFAPTFGDGGGADGDGSGTYTVTVSVDDEDGNTITQDLILTVNDVPQALSTTQVVTIEAESFDNQGGTQAGNEGIGVEDDPAGFVNIGFTHNGDFAQYEIDVPAAGIYEFTFSIAKGSNQAGSMDINGDPGSTITLDNTDNNGWGSYSDYVTQVSLPAGQQTLTFNWTSGGGGFLFNIEHFDISYQGAGNDAPVVTIISPANNATFTEGDNISFEATATDTEDGSLTASIDWISSLDGTIATDMGSFSSSALSVGTHTITAEVTDSDNETTAEQVIITVNSANPGNFQLCVACGSVGLNAFGRTFIGDNNNTPPTGQGFTRTGGKTFKGYSDPIAGTNTPDELLLFQKEIYGGAGGNDPSFTYEVPVTNGAYEVDLYFAEVFQDNPETRVFDVTLEGALLLPDYDMMNPDRDGLSSNQTAITRTYQVDVTDGSLTILVGPASVDNGKLAGFCVTEINDANLPPTSAIADITINAEEAAAEALNINDPESDNLIVTLAGLPTDGTLDYNPSTNQLEGTPTTADAGTYTIDVIVEDGTNSGILDQFELVVNPPAGNDPPVIQPLNELLVSEGGTATTTVTITDDNNVYGGSVVVYDKSVGNPSSNTIPGGVVDPADYSFTDANNDGVYDFSWTTGAGDGRSYRVDVTADDGVNAPVTATFNIQVGIPLVGTVPARFFGNPAPWYDSSEPGSGYSVSIESNTAQNIGYIDNGDFVDYFIDVPAVGTYDVAIQAAKGTSGTTTVSLEVDNGGGLTQTGSVGVTNNGGGWQDYGTYNTTATFANAGLQVLRLAFNGGANVLDLTFTSQNTGDVTPPVITITGDNPLNWPFGLAYMDPGATASDETDGDITGNVVTDASNVDINTLGTYQVTYNVSDAAGNDATEAIRTVEVTDQDPPVITLNGANPINLLVGDTYTEPGATATDNVDGAVTVSIGGDVVDPNTEGTYVVTYDAQDAAGNDATQVTRTVNVAAAPVTDVIISATPATQTVDQGQSFTVSVDMQANDQSVSAAEVILLYDPAVLTITQVTHDNSVFPLLADNGDPNNDPPGILTFASGKQGPALVNGSVPLFDVTFQAVGSGTTALEIDFETVNTPEITRVLDIETDVLTAVNDASVTINPTVDNTPPVITLLGDNPLTIFQGSTYTDPGATAEDDIDGDITNNIVVGGDAVDPSTLGSYFVTYDVMDAANNAAEQKTREVIVTDAPNLDVIMSVTPAVVTVDQGQTFTVNVDVQANDQGINSAGILLSYDPAVLNITSVTPNQSIFSLVAENDASVPGVFQYASAFIGQPFPTGAVPLVTIEFEAIGSGSSTLALETQSAEYEPTDVQANGVSVLTSVENSNVTVNANPEITLEAVPSAFTADAGTTDTQTGNLTGDASDQSTIPTAISLTDDADWLTVPATAPQGSPVNFTIDPSGLAAGTYTATITGSATGYQDGIATVTLSVLGIPEVQVSITPNSGLNASTFSNNSFQIDYLDDGNGNVPLPNIQSISFDLSSGILPDMVFDPVGAGGDATSSCLTPNQGAAATGLIAPSDPCVDPFSVPRNGGFDVMTVNFGDFNEGENFEFTTDVDPNNIQGVAGAGNAGAVSGFELVGTKVTITFDNGLVLSGSLFEDGSLGGSTTIGAQPANVPTMPVLSTVNGTTPQTVNTTNQTVTVTGDPGSYVGLLQMDSRLFIASGDDPFDVSPEELPFYANEAMAKGLYTAQIGAGGSVDIPVTMQQTPGSNNTPDGGLNYFMAVTSSNPYAVGQEASMASVPLIIKLDLGVPVITLLGDNPLELLAGETYVEPGATATDNEDGDISGDIVIDASAVNTAVAGTYDVTYNVTDAAGNAATEVVRTVIVSDNDPPVITLLGDDPLLVPLNGTYTDPGATANDAVDGDLTAQIIVGGDVVNTAVVGTYLVTYDVSDLQGNPATQVVRTVEVFDDEPPVITLVGDNPQIVALNGTYTELGATASDNVDGDISGDIVIDASNVDVNALGSYTVTYNVMDAAGNAAAEVTRTVIVTDQTAPVITLVGDNPQIVALNGTYTELGATASDNVDGDITGDIVIDASDVDVNAFGSYTVTYNVMDAAGNAATEVTRTVIVEDVIAPVITLVGDNPLTIPASAPYVDPGATANDNVDGDISANIMIDDSDVNVDEPGSYTVTFNVSDAAGNAATEVTRTVIVEDVIAPVITLLGPNPLNLSANSTYIEPNATASDNVDGDLTGQIVIDASAVNTSVPGTYEVTYNVSDAAGNPATEVIREVVVSDNSKPVIALVGPATLNLNIGDTYTEQGATAIDDVDGNISNQIAIGGDVVNTSLPGIYTVTYNVNDAAGNAADEVTRTVNVTDVTPPTITLLGDNPVELAAGDTYSEPGFTAVDNVDGDVSGNVQIGGDAVDTNVPDTYIITYNVSDAAGNAATEVTRTVVVTDQTAPVITLNGPNPLILAAGSTYVEAGATAQDNVDGDISGAIAINNSALNTSIPGSYDIIYSVSDAAGNPAQETRTVIVEDQSAPIITLIGQNPLTVPASSPYNDPGAIAIDNVDGDISANIQVDDSAVDTDVPGSYQVTYDVMDAAGNPAIQKVRTVIVEDQTPPVIVLNGANPLNLAVGDTYNEPGATASDNVDGDLTGAIVIDASVVNTAVAGSYQVTYDVMDAAGNNATTAIRTVNVSDQGGPVITLLGDNPLTLEVGDPYIEPGATASDDVDGDLSGDILIDASAVNTNAPGSYEVTYNVADGAGNAAIEAIRTVNVIDVSAPVITLVGNNPQIIAVGDSYTELGAVAFDDEDGNISGDIVIDASAVNTNIVGTYVVTYNVSDDAGNAATEVTRTVQVTDQTAPVITLTGDNPQTISLNNAYTELGATATDNVDGDISGLIQIDASGVNTSAPGTYTVTYNVSDAAGNAATQVTRTVEVVDQIMPVITLLGDNPLELAVGDTYVDPGATATDVSDGNITDDIVVGGDIVDTGTPDSYVVTYNVQDAAGNAALEVTRDVIVTDEDAPVITLNGANPLILQVGSTYVEPGATAQDNVDGNVTANIVADNSSVNTAVTGSYTVTYSVSDAAGNLAQETRTVTVEDMTAPTITLLGDNPLTVPASMPYNDPGAVAFDNYDGNITANIIVDASDVDTDVPGTYTVTYNVSDAAGNAATEVIRTVNVEDVTPPVIALNGANPLNLAVGDTYNEPGATATDNVDGDLTGAIVIDASAVNTAIAGSYQVTYDVMDAAGNNATTAIRTVNVSDQGMPSITLLGDNPLTIQAGTPYAEPGATATDDIDGDISDDIVIDASDVDTDEPGEYEVTYNVTDGSGNPAIEVIRTVIVEDMSPPVIGLLGNNPQVVAVGAPYVEAGAVATDDVDGNISGQIVIDAAAVNTNTAGDYIVTYNVTDASGNAAQEVTRTVQVRDQDAPVITLLGDNPQLVAFGGTYTEQGATATDNVDGDISGQITIDASAVNPNVLGSYTVTYNVTDAAGNAASEVSRTVTVTDQMGPIITLLGDNPLELDQFAPYVEPGATATDDVDGDVSGDIVIDASAVDVSTPGSYPVTYNVMDSDGNMATEVIRTVNVNDVTAPAIALLGANPLNLAVGDTYVEAGAIATDDVDGNLNSSIMIDDSDVDMNTPGTYEVVYTVEDAAANMAMVKRTVNVTDQDGPVITLMGPDPIQVPANNPYVDPGATATDFVDGDVSGDIVVDASAVDVTTLGTYTVTFNVTDAAGNAAAEVTRTVEVIAPATLLGEITLEANTNQAASDLVLKLYEPGTDNQVGGDYTPASDNSGLFSIGDLPFGTYDVYIKKSNFLQVVANNVTLNSGSNPPVVFPTMLAGDADGDNEVTAFDYDIYIIAYGSETGDATYDARTDYNRDGLIFLPDFSLWANNLNLKGADPADNE
jgi:large repetitive protein